MVKRVFIVKLIQFEPFSEADTGISERGRGLSGALVFRKQIFYNEQFGTNCQGKSA